MNKSPLLSIVIPCFNHPEELRVMLDSILSNSVQDWELILIDDGSTDLETLKIQKAYSEHDNRITMFCRDIDPKGAQTCRNIGLSKARGKYVCFFDSDDYIIPTCFEQRISWIEKNEDVDFVVFPTAVYNNGNVVSSPKSACFGYQYYKDDIAAFCEMTLPFIVCSNIYKRESLIAHNIQWDTKLVTYHDELFNLACLTSGMKYVYANNVKPDYAYRLTTSGSTSKQTNAEPYLSNSLYAMEWRFSHVQKLYGHKYDRELYYGAWHTWFANSRKGRVPKFTEDMKTVVLRFAPKYGKYFGENTFFVIFLIQFIMNRVVRNILLQIQK